MAAPTMTFNAAANVANVGTIAASGTSTTAAVDASTKFEAQYQISVVFGTVAATSGLQVDVFPDVAAGTSADTIAALTLVIPSTTSTTKRLTFKLPTGKHDLKLTNLDATNSVTSTTITSATIDTVV